MAKRQSTVKIPFGPPGREGGLSFTARVTDAKRNVSINGRALDALRACRGVTIGCAISNTAMANVAAFPHKVYYAHITATCAYLVDKINSNGQPTHAVRYHHAYKHITEDNDTGAWKKMVAETPTLMERSFALRVPRTSKPTGPHATKRAATSTNLAPRNSGARGAIRRAKKAGFISDGVAALLNAKSAPKPQAAQPEASEQGYA